MTKPARRVFIPLISAVTVTMIAAPCLALADTATPYLSWQNKTSQTASAQLASTGVINTSEGPYPVPASPYGQVGDPFARALRWPAKRPEAASAQQPIAAPATAAVMPPQPQTFVSVPQAPVRAPQVASISAPMPLSAPRPVTVVPLPQPVQVPSTEEREDLGLADDPGMAEDAPLITPAPVAVTPVPQPKPATSHAEQMAASRPLPAPKPVTPPTPLPAVASIPATPLTPASPSAGYQVPSTSKYAARIESARAAHAEPAPAVATAAPAAKPPAAKPVVKKPSEKTQERPPVATAPEPSVSMAVRETDHVFIPGEQYTSAADEPRYYSLHRQYGLRPDPIPATHEATGALLSGTIDTVEAGEQGGDPNDDTADKDKKSASH